MTATLIAKVITMKNQYGPQYEILNMGMQTYISKFQRITHCLEKPSSNTSPIKAEVPKYKSLAKKYSHPEQLLFILKPILKKIYKLFA